MIKPTVYGTLCLICAFGAPLGSASADTIYATEFPKTIKDLPFIEQLKNKGIGYLPFEGKRAYDEISLETEQDALEYRQQLEEARQQLQQGATSKEEYCEKYPFDITVCAEETQLEPQNISQEPFQSTNLWTPGTQR